MYLPGHPFSSDVPFNPDRTVWQNYTVNLPPAQGWQCPVCKAVWAPGICGCMNCNSGRHTVTISGIAPLTVGGEVSPLTVDADRKDDHGGF